MSAINGLVGGNVRAARLDRGLTQRDLAVRLTDAGWKIDASALARIESGERALRIEQVEVLARALELTLTELIVDTEPASLEKDAQALIAAIDELLDARQKYETARERLERHVSTAADERKRKTDAG